MTERGLPIADGAPACPFVAFEDDRDERAASPDHRHRCYAEAQPAPRALAHQEAYCLSSAFPVCPTFQDWARREAARSRLDAPRPMDPALTGARDHPQRNPPRNWSEPPPWMSRADRADRADGADRGSDPDWDEDAEGEEGADEPVRADVPRRGRGLSGSYADRVASDPIPGMPGGLPDDPDATYESPDWEDDGGNQQAAPPATIRRRERDPGRVAALAGGGESHGGAGSGGPDRRPDRRREGPTPEWERAKPLEAYPTLRSRRLPELSIPPILVAVVALALAAAVLFALPGLLGFGNPGAATSPTPSTPVRTALPSLGPTPIPQPTQQIYVVQANDTMSKIAGRFDIALADLIAANAENIPDPDSLQIGDQVIIPAPVPTSLPAASEIPAAT